MTKLVDRLAKRKTPEHQLMKEIVYLTQEALGTGDTWPLEERLETLLKELSAEAFEKVFWDALLELAHDEDADALRFELQATLESLISDAITRDMSVRLVGLPFALAAKGQGAWDQPVTPELEARVKELLMDKGWVAADAVLHVFPQILTAGAGGALPYGTVYRMRSQLAQGDLAAAQSTYAEAIREAEGDSPLVPAIPADQVVMTCGILMLTVTTREDEALPLEVEFHRMLDTAQSDEEREALYQEVTDLHIQFLQDLLPALQGVAVEPAGAFGDWFESLYALRRIQREAVTLQEIRDVAGDNGTSEPSSLVTVSGPLEVRFANSGLPRVRVPLKLKSTGAPCAVEWPSFSEEQPHECMELLQAFLLELGLKPAAAQALHSGIQLDALAGHVFDEPDDDGPASPPPARRVLH